MAQDVQLYSNNSDETAVPTPVSKTNSLDVKSTSDFKLRVSNGELEGQTLNQAFGCNPNVGASFEVISADGVYRMPTTATALEILSSSGDDTSAGTGARTVLVTGLDANFAEQTETVTMNGTTPVTLANTYIRFSRAIVASSGTYTQDTTGSHVGVITIRETGAGDIWASMQLDGFATGNTSMAAFTVPLGFSAQVYGAHFNIDSNKLATVSFVVRSNADDVSAPFSGSFIPLTLGALSGFQYFTSQFPVGVFPEKTDFWLIGQFSTGSGEIDATLEILLTETNP